MYKLFFLLCFILLFSSCSSVDIIHEESIPGIICYGDSLTAGAGGEGVNYPDVLAREIENKILNDKYSFDVVNYGVGGESSLTIASRSGAIPLILSEDLVISADKKNVGIKFETSTHNSISPLRQNEKGDRGVNPIIVNGIEGELIIEQEDYLDKTYNYYFKRNKRGEEIIVPKGSEIKFNGSISYKDYAIVLFIGQNGGWESDPQVLIRQQEEMINLQNEEIRDKFIIVGLHTGTRGERATLEEAMKKQWGDKYINLREYMSSEALSDACIKPTVEDLKAIEEGRTPPSLLSDNVHFNSIGYELIGKLIFKTMDDLGYFSSINV